jgi:hypothetical protein
MLATLAPLRPLRRFDDYLVIVHNCTTCLPFRASRRMICSLCGVQTSHCTVGLPPWSRPRKIVVAAAVQPFTRQGER